MTVTAEKYKRGLHHFFNNYGGCIRDSLSSSTKGKIYEIYCLRKLLVWIKNRYKTNIRYCDPFGDGVIRLKSAPGKIKRSKNSYFAVSSSNSGNHNIELEVHMNIEILTDSVDDLDESEEEDQSYASEIDIVLVIGEPTKDDFRPRYTDLVLGIECKFHSKFKKSTAREVIGTRKEIGAETGKRVLFRLDEMLSLKPNKNKRYSYFQPSSEYWLAQIQDVPNGIKKRLKKKGVKLYYWRQKV